MAGITGRLIKGSVWLSLARAIANGLQTVSLFVLARYLEPTDFGLVALGTTMLLIVTTITDLSLSEALIRQESPDESHFSTVWTLTAGRGLILCLIFAACAYPMSLIYKEPRLIEVMLALSLSVFMSGLTNPRRIMLQRALVFWQEFVLTVSQRLAGVIASVAVAVIYRSYWALVVGMLVTQLTNICVSYMVMPFRPRITFQHVREFLSFSGWLTAGQIVNTLNWRFDYLLHTRRSPGDAADARSDHAPHTDDLSGLLEDPEQSRTARCRVSARAGAGDRGCASGRYRRRGDRGSAGQTVARREMGSRWLRFSRCRPSVRWFNRSAWRKAKPACCSCATRRCCLSGCQSSLLPSSSMASPA